MQVRNNHELSILTLELWKKKRNGTRNMKNINFVPRDVQRILSSHKNFGKMSRYSIKKTVLNNFVIFTEKYLGWCLFFNKNAGLYACNFNKKRLQHRCFLVNIAKSLRTAILKNICEPLLLRVFPFMSIWTFSYMNK